MTADVLTGGAAVAPHPVDERPCASYTLRVNGFERPVTDAWIGESLLYVLRERLGLAGAKNGCEQGECGACSVQVDGQLVAGCLVPAALAADSEINTVEGLSAAGAASDVQQALAESGAVQCGYCTPGMAMAVHDLLQRNHRPSEVEARQALCGNLCRCTGYRSALAAVQTVAEARGAALLEAEEATEPEPVAAAAPVAPEAQPEPEAPDLPVYQEAWTQAAAPGEPSVFVADEGWITAEALEPAAPAQPSADYQPRPTATGVGAGVGMIPAQGHPGQGQQSHGQQGQQAPGQQAPGQQGQQGQQGHAQAVPSHPGYDPTAYGPGTVYDAGASYEPTPAHGTAYEPSAYDTGSYQQPSFEPSQQFEPAPFEQTSFEQRPFEQAPYTPPVYESAPYQGAPYAEGGGYPSYDGVPGHGIPAPTVSYDETVYESAPGAPSPYDGAPYDGTPAHGIRLPEDDHA